MASFAPTRSAPGLVATMLFLSLAMPGLLPAEEKLHNGGEHVTVEYYRGLAESGSADAQLTLGDLYSNGSGVPLDLVEAYAWYYLAAQQGVEEAIRPMNDVLRALPEAQWPSARKRAEEYERRYMPRGG